MLRGNKQNALGLRRLLQRRCRRCRSRTRRAARRVVCWQPTPCGRALVFANYRGVCRQRKPRGYHRSEGSVDEALLWASNDRGRPLGVHRRHAPRHFKQRALLLAKVRPSRRPSAAAVGEPSVPARCTPDSGAGNAVDELAFRSQVASVEAVTSCSTLKTWTAPAKKNAIFGRWTSRWHAF